MALKFGSLKQVFETLASEDYEFLDGKFEEYPSFGDENSTYDDVCLKHDLVLYFVIIFLQNC
ncbi:unnamed protein product [Brugia pahangi]|uniref:Transposase n=1 Tax=Brugia pahangi TaxID=6280 RepID=A0A0N4TI11_BRUPA|nr:unnamed protein product [Brugia pahangi]